MEWKKITDTMNPYITRFNPYIDKAKEYSKKINPYVDKAKVYGKKIAEFAEDQIQVTPLFIKSQAEYDSVLLEKRVIIIAYDDTHAIAQDVRVLGPVWITRAFMDAAKLRFISLSEPTEFARNIGFTYPIDMRVEFEGEETFHFTSIEDIKKWWQSPIYKKIETKNEKPLDPLQSL